ncbi:hypothetical protein Tco_0375401 [Tanacetum coccineum]
MTPKVTKDTSASANTEAPNDVQLCCSNAVSLIQILSQNVSSVDTSNLKHQFQFIKKKMMKAKEKSNEQIGKFYESFKDMNFEICFLDALTLMLNLASNFKKPYRKQENLSELAKLKRKLARRASLRSCLKNLETRRILIPYRPPSTLYSSGECFLKTSRALIDVHEGEITLRVGKEAITFNLDQTSRYTANFNHMTANRIDVIDMASEEYSQEVLGSKCFLDLDDDYNFTEVDIRLLMIPSGGHSHPRSILEQ